LKNGALLNADHNTTLIFLGMCGLLERESGYLADPTTIKSSTDLAGQTHACSLDRASWLGGACVLFNGSLRVLEYE